MRLSRKKESEGVIYGIFKFHCFHCNQLEVRSATKQMGLGRSNIICSNRISPNLICPNLIYLNRICSNLIYSNLIYLNHACPNIICPNQRCSNMISSNPLTVSLKTTAIVIRSSKGINQVIIKQVIQKFLIRKNNGPSAPIPLLLQLLCIYQEPLEFIDFTCLKLTFCQLELKMFDSNNSGSKFLESSKQIASH